MNYIQHSGVTINQFKKSFDQSKVYLIFFIEVLNDFFFFFHLLIIKNFSNFFFLKKIKIIKLLAKIYI